MSSDSESNETGKLEQSLVNELAREMIQEHRRSRRWSVFFKLLLALYVLGFFMIYLAEDSKMGSLTTGEHTALIEIDGVISSDSESRADYVVSGLRKAFKDTNTKGVILRINSPGGSPVQAGYINDEIKRLRGEYPDIPLYAVISDICASGGYYIAAAADEIYANKASIVGSIGVIMASFGFVEAIEKLGVERRLLHAGENKGFLDPFQPVKEDEVEHIQGLLDNVHQQFIDVVKEGRGEKIKDSDQLFTGLIWSGADSVELGLVDGLASASQVARDIIGAEDIVDFTRRETYLDRFPFLMGEAIFRSFTETVTLR